LIEWGWMMREMSQTGYIKVRKSVMSRLGRRLASITYYNDMIKDKGGWWDRGVQLIDRLYRRRRAILVTRHP
jgi:hypothetical protein